MFTCFFPTSSILHGQDGDRFDSADVEALAFRLEHSVGQVGAASCHSIAFICSKTTTAVALHCLPMFHIGSSVDLLMAPLMTAFSPSGSVQTNPPAINVQPSGYAT